MKKGFIRFTDFVYKKEYAIISQIFKDFRPTHIEFRHWENDVWYIYGESECFDEVIDIEGMPQDVPQYEVIFKTRLEGGYSHEFRKFNR